VNPLAPIAHLPIAKDEATEPTYHQIVIDWLATDACNWLAHTKSYSRQLLDPEWVLKNTTEGGSPQHTAQNLCMDAKPIFLIPGKKPQQAIHYYGFFPATKQPGP